MTREEAKITLEKICSNAISDALFEREAIALEEFVDKIYDNFESRTCENCKYSFKSDYKRWLECNKCCAEEIINGTSDGVISRSFSCNKWEQK